MKKERFKNIGTDIFHYGEWWCSAGGEHCADVIATALNEIMDKNAQLKKENKEYIRGLELKKAECQSWASDVRELREQNCQLEKEIKQLKSDNRLLYSRNTDLKRKNELYDAENEQLKSKNKILKEDLEHCANQFTDDGKNVLLNLR